MEGQKHKTRPHRKKLQGSNYSEAFKRQVVQAYLTGEDDQRLVAGRFGISQCSVARWAKEYPVPGTEIGDIALNCGMTKSKGTEDADKDTLKQKIRELELALEEEHLKRVGYQTMVEIAEKELKIDIRKKSNTKQSKG